MLNQNVIVGASALVNILLGFFIFLRNTRSRANQAYLILTLNLILWMISSFFTDNAWSFNAKLIFGKITFVLGLSIGITLLNLGRSFPVKRKSTVFDQMTIGLFVIVSVLCFTDLIVYNIELTDSGVSNIIPGKLYLVWIGTFIIASINAVLAFWQQYKNADKLGKSQLRLMMFGISIGLFFGLLTNVIIPAIAPSLRATNYGPLATVILVATSGYAIIRHKLFDVRLVVARSLAYVFSIGAMVGAYLLVAFGAGQLISLGTNLNSQQRLFYVGVALLFALTLPALKRLFDKITNRLFYRDAYDSQVVLDIVSGVIVGNIDQHKVQRGALNALFEALRPTYMIFLFKNGTDKLHEGDLVGQHWNMHDPSKLQDSLKRVNKKIILYDELEEKEAKLRDTLRVEDISVAAPLVTKDEHIGYLILGPKKSGNIYNSQDVGLLNIATNELAVALQNAQRFEEIQAFNITLQEKVTEATRELKKTNRKLIALDEAKDEFISMASHQLRTPLTSIKGYLSMLAEGDLGKVTKAQEKAIKEAFGSSQRMVYLIADFLNVSRIKTGKFVIEPKEVDLPMVVSEEITQLREMAGSRDITLQYQAPEVFPKVMLDDNKIRQVMMNIVDNAIYYTPAGGTVTIQLFVDSADVVFKVIDTGIGVPKREQHKLFTKFFRAGNARKARPDGTGLGLFMAQKIIAEQGGSIIFESTEGKGSTFGFRFPLSKIKT